jgi:hypothetical protein
MRLPSSSGHAGDAGTLVVQQSKKHDFSLPAIEGKKPARRRLVFCRQSVYTEVA